MAVREYTYGEMLTEIKEEFGYKGTDKDDFIGRRINKSLHMLSRRREAWHFLTKPLVINIDVKVTGTATFPNAAEGTQLTVVVYTTTPETQIRHVLDGGSASGDMIDGSLVVARAAGPNTLDLDANWLKTSGAALPFTSVVGFHELPEDFSKMYLLADMSDNVNRLRYMDPQLLEMKRIQGVSLGSVNRRYTVVPDPLIGKAADSSPLLARQFLMVYPFITSATVLRGLYFFDFQNLDVTADISFLPRKNRPLIITAASWYVALAIGDSRLDEYKQQTINEIEEMASETSFSDDEEQLNFNFANIFLESSGFPGPDGPGFMPSFNEELC